MFGFRKLSTRCVLSASIAMTTLSYSESSGKLIRGFDSQGRVNYYERSSDYESVWDSNWDMREEKKNKNKVVHQIVMVRHGQYDREGKTDAEHKLTEKGRQQAVATGKRLNDLLVSGQISPVKTMYFSTMTRATETCQLILPEILPATTATTTAPAAATAAVTLSSTSTSVGVGSTYVTPHMRVEACSMIREGAVYRPSPPCTGWDPSEEEFEKEGYRVAAAFKNHMHRAEEDEVNNYSTVLVCHGNVIRYFVMKSLQLPPEAWLRLNAYNGSITVLEVRANGNVSLRTMGDVGHMPTDLITYN